MTLDEIINESCLDTLSIFFGITLDEAEIENGFAAMDENHDQILSQEEGEYLLQSTLDRKSRDNCKCNIKIPKILYHRPKVSPQLLKKILNLVQPVMMMMTGVVATVVTKTPFKIVIKAKVNIVIVTKRAEEGEDAVDLHGANGHFVPKYPGNVNMIVLIS